MKQKRKSFPIRLSDSERSALEEKALAAGLKLGDYLRRSGLNKKVKAVVPTVNRHTYLKLAQIQEKLSVQPSEGGNLDLSLLHELRETIDQVRLEILGLAPNQEEHDCKTN